MNRNDFFSPKSFKDSFHGRALSAFGLRQTVKRTLRRFRSAEVFKPKSAWNAMARPNHVGCVFKT